MKKIYSFLFMALLTAGAFAQTNIGSEHIPNLRKPISIPSIPINSARSGTSQIFLDYDSADTEINFVSQSNYIWNMNMHYSLAGHDTNSWQTCIVRFDSLYDANTQITTNNAQVTNIVVDSIYALLGHSNMSTQNDTLITRIIPLNASGYPVPTTTLWADTMITDTSWSVGGSWLQTTYFQWSPAKNLGAGVNNFAVELDYYDPSKLDTCGFIAGFSDQGLSGTCSQTAAYSNFYPNSYAAWTKYGATYPLLPDPTGIDIYYDCLGLGHDTVGQGHNYIQDIYLGAWITVTTNNVGINEDLKNTGIGLYQNIPNPFHSSTDIKYELANDAKDVVLSIYDIVGNKVMQAEEGTKTSGQHVIRLDASKLAKGMYSYTLRVDGSQLTKRMVIE
jgi:hypothetical protein